MSAPTSSSYPDRLANYLPLVSPRPRPPANTPSSGPADRLKTPPSTERGVSPANRYQLAGLRAVTIHVALSIITDRSPGRPAKAARTAAEARARMSLG